MEVLDALIAQKEPLQKIFVTIYGHFKKLFLVKEALRLNKDVLTNVQLSKNKPSSFVANKYINQSKNFTESGLKCLMKEFLNLDLLSKEYRIDLRVGLDAILCKYCG